MQELTPQKRARLQKCFEYGNQKMQLGDHDYATEMFAQCVIGDPSNLLYMNSFIVNLRQKVGAPKKKGALARAVKKPITIPTKIKDLETAIADGVARLRKDPWDAQAFVTMGVACLEEDLEEAGLAYLKHAVTCEPDDVEVSRLAARELGERKRYDDALACWSRINKLRENDEEAKKMLSSLMLEKTMIRMNGANRGEKEAAENAESDSPEQKLSFEDQIEKRLRKNPEDRDAFAELVDYFYQKGNMRKVEDACKRALKVFPDDDVFTQQLLEAQKIRAREEMARIKELYEKNPSDSLKQKFAEQKKIFDEKTFEHIQFRLKKSPANCSLHYEMGAYYMQRGMYKEAIKEFQAAKPDMAIAGECLLALAQCFQQIKQYRLALSHYDQAIETLPKTGEEIKKALYYGARLALGLEDYNKADDYANQLAAIDFSYKDVGGLLDKIASKMHNR